MKGFNIWVTRKCNLECTYCYEGGKKKNMSLSRSKIEAVVSFVRKQSVSEDVILVNFHGGEPLLEINIIEDICCMLVEERKCIFSLTTNGTVIDEHILDVIIKYGINVSVSIDGVEKIHNTNRMYKDGAGSFEKALSMACLLKEQGIIPRVRMTVVPNNCMFLRENVEFLLKQGFSRIAAIPDLYSKHWDDEMIGIIKEQLIVLYSKTREKEFVFFDELRKKSSCYGGIREINIDVDLKVYPCSLVVGDMSMAIGNVEQGINPIALKQWKDKCDIGLENCNGCMFINRCIANRCRVVSTLLNAEAFVLICEFTNIVKNALEYRYTKNERM